MFDHCIAPRPGNPHDVESRVALMESFLSQEILSHLNHFVLLAKLNGFERLPKTMAGTSFHFDKHNDTAVENNEVQFPHRATVIALDQLVAFPLEIFFRETFAFFS
jgi:hypothetical protein